MSGINHDRLVELFLARQVMLAPNERSIMPSGEVVSRYSPAYWLGRVDEFAAQNAIEPEELVAAWDEARGAALRS